MVWCGTRGVALRDVGTYPDPDPLGGWVCILSEAPRPPGGSNGESCRSVF